ncbi:MAG: hypothetical protein Q7U80_06525 [Thiobacillus sp.]|nr:hypothetical protein [Thiobacillus sp.]
MNKVDELKANLAKLSPEAQKRVLKAAKASRNVQAFMARVAQGKPNPGQND